MDLVKREDSPLPVKNHLPEKEMVRKMHAGLVKGENLWYTYKKIFISAVLQAFGRTGCRNRNDIEEYNKND